MIQSSSLNVHSGLCRSGLSRSFVFDFKSILETRVVFGRSGKDDRNHNELDDEENEKSEKKLTNTFSIRTIYFRAAVEMKKFLH